MWITWYRNYLLIVIDVLSHVFINCRGTRERRKKERKKKEHNGQWVPSLDQSNIYGGVYIENKPPQHMELVYCGNIYGQQNSFDARRTEWLEQTVPFLHTTAVRLGARHWAPASSSIYATSPKIPHWPSLIASCHFDAIDKLPIPHLPYPTSPWLVQKSEHKLHENKDDHYLNVQQILLPLFLFVY